MNRTSGIPKVSRLRFYTRAREILRNPLPFHHDNFERCGDTFTMDTGLGRRIIFSRDAAFAQYVLQKNHRNYTKSAIQQQDMAKYLGNGLLTSEGEAWRGQRKLIQPAFHRKSLDLVLKKIHDAILTELQRIPANRSVDIFPVMSDLAFQSVVKALFSGAVDQDEIDRLQFFTQEAQAMLVRELRQPYLGWWFKWRGMITKHLDLAREAKKILLKVIRDRRQAERNPGDLLDMLLEARYDDGSHMHEQQLLDEILILFTAGHETASNALTFTCQLLARHPAAQEKIASEARAAKETGGDPMEIIRGCTYTELVILEAMRLFPPVYFIDRVNKTDDAFEGKSFPAGSTLLFSLFEIHRHPGFWRDPTLFQPERFNRSTNSHYFPFGAGPRKCIGSNFAMYEMVLCISELISRFRILPENSLIEMQPLITLKPKNAILKFEER